MIGHLQIKLQNSSDPFGTGQVTGPLGAEHFHKKNHTHLKLLIRQVAINHQYIISGSLDSLGSNYLSLFSRIINMLQIQTKDDALLAL